MFTQSMPALAQALSGALPEAALRQLMQSLGNCQQPLSHRGAVNFQPPTSTGVGGLANPGTWRPSDYANILPKAGDNVFFDVAGDQYNNTDNSHNYDGNQFNFPLNPEFNYNNYYGGDTFNVAGNSYFDNSTVNNLKAGDLTVNNLSITNRIYNYTTTGGGGDGGGGGGTDTGGGGGFFPGGPGFPMPGVPQPASTQVATYLKDVIVTGSVDAPTVESAKVKDASVTLTPGTQTIPLTVTGSVEVPVAQSGKLSAITGTGSIAIPTVTGGTLSGATASGSISYDTYPTATCSAISASVAIPVVTGGYLDSSCKFVPTTSTQTFTVTVSTPTITLNKSSASVTPTLSVSGGTFTPTTSSSTQAVTVTTTAATVTITNTNQTQQLSATGEIQAPIVKTAALADSTVSLTPGTSTKTLKLKVVKKSDFLIYLRPRA